VCKGDESVMSGFREHDMISSNGRHVAAIDVAVDAIQYHFFGSILRFDQAIPQRSPSESRGSGSRLLCVKGFVETTAHRTAEALQVGVAEGIHLTLT